MKIINVFFKRPFGFLFFLFLMVLLISFPFFIPIYSLILLTTVLMYVILTVSWMLFSGPTGYISLAPAAFFGVGVYSSALFALKLPMYLVIGIGSSASFCLALIVGALTLRLRGAYFVMFTFGLVELLLNAVLWWEVNISVTTGRVVPSMPNQDVYYIMLGIFFVLLLTSLYVNNSRFGLALRSIGESEEAAAHIGIHVTALKVSTFALSALFMGAAGAVMATRWTYIDPKIAFNPLLSFLPVLMAIFGGMGQLYGPVAGAAIFTYLEQFLITRLPYHYMIIFGAIMIFAILYLPDGLVGFIEKLWKRMWGKAEHADT